ncbi:TadE/TadG family type IV pilus assembly protein [Propionibacteriaceae bacterium Y2011]
MEVAVLLPVLLAVVLITVQVAIHHHAVNTAQAAAAACAERAAGYDATLGDGVAAARSVLSQVNGLDDARVVAHLQPGAVRCVVTGSSPGLLTGGAAQIVRTASQPTERLG